MASTPTQWFDGKKLRILRRQRGYFSQRAFGELVGVSRQIVNYWENGKRLPPESRITRCAEILSCEPSALLAEV
jgi:transcriptional regulator with XRE-family HTH domain